MEILYYKIIPGTMSLDSDHAQKMMVDMIMEEIDDLHGVSNLVLEYVQNLLHIHAVVFTLKSNCRKIKFPSKHGGWYM